MKKTTTVGKTDTQKSMVDKKKRCFFPGKYYLFDENNQCLAITSNPKELQEVEFEDTDTILIAVHPDKMFPNSKRKATVDKIVLDFDKEEITIEGSSCTIAKVSYEGNQTYSLDEEDLADWEEMIKDSKKIAKEFIMIGTPPIKGELLDVE